MPSGRSAVISAIASLDVLAQREDVAAVAHGDGKPDGRLAVDAKQRLRRIGKAAPDLGDVAEAKHAAADGEVDVAHVLLGFETRPRRAARASRSRSGWCRPAGRRSAPAGRRSGPSGRCRDWRAPSSRTRRRCVSSWAPRISILETSATLQKLRADVLDIVAQLAMREAVGGEAVDDPEGVAEIVVEARPDDAGRQGVADVADALAHVIPDVRHLLGGRRCPAD